MNIDVWYEKKTANDSLSDDMLVYVSRNANNDCTWYWCCAPNISADDNELLSNIHKAVNMSVIDTKKLTKQAVLQDLGSDKMQAIVFVGVLSVCNDVVKVQQLALPALSEMSSNIELKKIAWSKLQQLQRTTKC